MWRLCQTIIQHSEKYKQVATNQRIAIEYNVVLIYLAACYKISLSNMWFKGRYTVALYCQTQVIHSIVTF